MVTITITVGEDVSGSTLELACNDYGTVTDKTLGEFTFVLADRDQNDIRWYLEEYLEHDAEPAPILAANVERRLSTIGSTLFGIVFRSSIAAQRIWSSISDRLHQVRVELRMMSGAADALPWESIRETPDAVPIAARVHSFVRSALAPENPPTDPAPQDSLRILMVISRPQGEHDVPFLSVARGAVRHLERHGCTDIDLNVLRPATVDALQERLREAAEIRRPYHLVHFDGHGIAVGNRGVILFESPDGHGHEPVDGRFVGRLLTQNNVPVLILNACRSADSQFTTAGAASPSDPRASSIRNTSNGSFAWEATQSGVAAVLAMRYNIYVDTAALFIASVYEALREGTTLAEAVSAGRQRLFADPTREIGPRVRTLQDWIVPVLYEQYPVQFQVARRSPARASDENAPLPPSTPIPLPTADFYGRDETMLALERQFRSVGPVLLHAMAGMGKTTTAKEFARWLYRTGGLDDAPIFSSFSSYRSLDQLLSEVVLPTYQQRLTNHGILWDTLGELERVHAALGILSGRRVLWIWDNVEEVAGFPSGTRSKWTPDEQTSLKSFLRELSQAGVRILLTSRRDEKAWLGSLPSRVVLRPMSPIERFRMVRGIAGRLEKSLTDLSDWADLVAFSAGNPLTLRILARSAMQGGNPSRDQLASLLSSLRSGLARNEQQTQPELAASLSYGFNGAFAPSERRQLALLSLFDGVVDAQLFTLMGDRDIGGALAEVLVTLQEASILLDTADELGLVSRFDTYRYRIHPALPWFLGESFTQLYSSVRADAARRAFAVTMAIYADNANHQIQMGNRLFRERVQQDEANLLRAMRIALGMDLADAAVSNACALLRLYLSAGRRIDMHRLLDEIGSAIDDPITGTPLIGRETQWMEVAVYRAALARESRQWEEVTRLIDIWEPMARRLSATALLKQATELTEEDKHRLKSLSVMFHEIAGLRMAMDDPRCANAFAEDFELSIKIHDHTGAAITAYNAGQAHLAVQSIHNVSEAERWCHLSLNLRDPRDVVGRARCHLLLARIACARADEASNPNGPELKGHIMAAIDWCNNALNALPLDAFAELSVAHNMAGTILSNIGRNVDAIRHYRACLTYEEQLGDVFGAGESRENIATVLLDMGRLDQAQTYALRALQDFEQIGGPAARQTHRVQELLDRIRSQMGTNRAAK
jgi:tetratricopeptide (TPR) repeat protein